MLIVVGILIYSLMFQGSRGIWEPDEGRYTNISLQMLRTGDFMFPAFNDDLFHFAKPPLTYWAIGAGVGVFGRNEWGARIPNAIAYTATILVVFFLGKRITPERPWLPAVVYASFFQPFAAANVITPDTLLTLWETLAVLGFVLWWERREEEGLRPSLILMWSSFGFAFLTKGPPGLLPLLAILVLVVMALGWRAIFRLVSISGLLIFAVVGFGWYVFVILTHPGLLTYFLRDEFVRRIATGTQHRNAHWYGALAVYLPAFIGGSLPWTFLLLRRAGALPQTLLSREWWRQKLKENQWPVFLVLWFLLPLTIFFIGQSRLPFYVLPLFVPLALTTGYLFRNHPIRPAFVYLLTVWFVILPAVKFGGSFYAYGKDSRTLARAITGSVVPTPKEIVFVDIAPYWGLNLYLDCEVERVTSAPSALARMLADETLSSELARGEPLSLLVVSSHQKTRIIEDCFRLGYYPQELGQIGSMVLVDPSSDFSKAPHKANRPRG